MRAVLFALVVLGAAVPAQRTPDVLRSMGGLPAHVAGLFENPIGFQQADNGVYYVFDRRAHAVYTVGPDQTPHKIIQVGQEAGRVLQPTAFDIDPADGSFVIADAPGRQQRVQTFTASGSRVSGFTLPGREVPRLTLDTIVLNGIGSLQYTGKTILLNQPDRGALLTELALDGTPVRTFGTLRATGHEADPDIHLALNAGLPLIDPTGGFFFVFQAGVPLFRKYDARGKQVYERHIEGPEVDEYLRDLPSTWLRRQTPDGDEVPFVPPAVRTAAVDRAGRLWVTLRSPVTYVYDPSGDKIRTVQFRAAGVMLPNSLFFTKDGRVLVTPGCYEFRSNF